MNNGSKNMGVTGSDIKTLTDGSQKTEIITLDEPVGVQNPLQVDGDSIYAKDIDVVKSDNGNFSGTVTDYFDSLTSIQSDITANNPKTIKLWFNRTIYSHSIGFGCDDLAKGFGNSITIKLLGSGEAVRFEKTFLPTDPNSFLAEFGQKAFNGIILEFNTAAEVCLSNLTIAKSIETKSSIYGLDANDEVQEVKTTEDGYLAISDNSNGLSIAQGNVSKTSFIHKFGNAPDFGSTDGIATIWDGANSSDIDQMSYVYSTSADIDSISSSSSSDNFELEIQGLDANYNVVIQTKTLQGQAKIALDVPLLRVFRVVNVNSSDNIGHVYGYVDTAILLGVPVDSTKVRAVIQPGNNQTLMAIYTVPAGRTGYMRDWYASIAGANKTSNYSTELRARPFSGVFQLKHLSSLTNTGTSTYQHIYNEPEIFAEKTDIEMRVSLTATGVSGASFSAGFDIVLIEN